MKSSILIWVAVGAVVLIGVVLAAGGWLGGPATQSEGRETGVSPMSQQGRSVTLQLFGQYEPQSGAALIREADGGTLVILDVTPRDGQSQPAHIHFGSCGDIGGIKYPLSDVLDGRSETMLDISFSDLMSEIPFAVNIHRSAEEASVYTSCGDLANPSNE